jgi:C-terminal processing protease CtpA/Prc
VILAWNVLKHFYPYFDVLRTDWQAELPRALKSAAVDGNAEEYLGTLRRMVARLHDGHAGVFHPLLLLRDFTLPLVWDWVEDRLVITHVAELGAEGLRPGDIVLKVNGTQSRKALEQLEEEISGATPGWRRYRALIELRTGIHDSKVLLQVESGSGRVRDVTLRRSLAFSAISEPRPAKIHEVRSGIHYVDLDRITSQDWQRSLSVLERARGIIFDLRGYPVSAPVVATHLIDRHSTSAHWKVPVVTLPDRLGRPEYLSLPRWDLMPTTPRLRARVAFIADARAISYAESILGIIEAYRLADIVGQATAGTNGNVNAFSLPGGYRISFTGMRVLKHDGSQHHGTGIRPTVPASRSIQGVRDGRDELLECAISVVSR